MTEKSFFWDATTEGDAILAPYSAADMQDIFRKQFNRSNLTGMGVLDDVLNNLKVTTLSSPSISLDTGRALVAGGLYENDTALSIEIPIPVTDPRIDLIVIRRSQVTQTIRAMRLAGTEDPSPNIPSAATDPLSIFELPIAEVLITTAGVLTITDRRAPIVSPLVPIGSKLLIEEIVAGADTFGFVFDDIPQFFKHLQMTGLVRHTNIDATRNVEFLNMRYNDDEGANYHYQVLEGYGTTIDGFSDTGQTNTPIASIPNSGAVNGVASMFEAYFPGYNAPLSRKVCFSKYSYILKNTDPSGLKEAIVSLGSLWSSVPSVIRKIDIRPRSLSTSTSFPFAEGSTISLYGYELFS